jgi:hypothetical protein
MTAVAPAADRYDVAGERTGQVFYNRLRRSLFFASNSSFVIQPLVAELGN